MIGSTAIKGEDKTTCEAACEVCANPRAARSKAVENDTILIVGSRRIRRELRTIEVTYEKMGKTEQKT